MNEWTVSELIAHGALSVTMFIIASVLWDLAKNANFDPLKARATQLFGYTLAACGVSHFTHVVVFFRPWFHFMTWVDMIAAMIAFVMAMVAITASKFTHPR